MIYILIVVGIIVAEKIIKAKIENGKSWEGTRLFNGSILINKYHNYGIAGGMFSNKPRLIKELLTIFIGIFGLIYVIMVLFYKKISFVSKVAMSFILGGAISNLIDRYKRGFVFDYFSVIHKKAKSISKFVFNIADIFIFIGVILVCIKRLWKGKR